MYMNIVVNKRRLATLLVLLLILAGGLILRANSKEVPVFEHNLIAVPGADMPMFYVNTKEKKVALTFDISWGESTVSLVLPILKEYGVKTTFFLSGPWVERYPETVNAIKSDGHEIASHGDRHVNLSQYSKAQISENIQLAHEAIKKVAGVEARFFRPPNGDYDDLVVATARELGYETVIWAIDSLDWKNPGPSYMVDRVTNLLFPGAIILFHASDSAKQTHLALPAVIQNIRSAGYEIVTLGALLKYGSPGRDDPRGRPRPR